ncbi:MAG: [Fe-Fe] hydrogenase large subunit C-terminal domain-containing protein [Bacteroidales bacterium]
MIEKEKHTFHHALKIVEEACIGCIHCMQVCPTEALRVRNGKAVLMPERCVDCGKCMKACPVNAIIVEQDDFHNIFQYNYRVAIVPSVFIGQFPRNIPTREIYSGILETGFTHVFEAEHGARLLGEKIPGYQKEHATLKPVISSFCPAIVRLIQVKFPTLVENIMLLKAPLDLAAIAYRNKLIESGLPEKEIGVFYITPCAAKIAAVKSPVGERQSPFNGVINMNFLYNKVFSIINRSDRNYCQIPDKEQLRDTEMLWSLTNGETGFATGRSLAIDGIQNVTEFLENLENDSVGVFDFLELRACDQGCAGGILSVANRFLCAERLRNRANDYIKESRNLKTHTGTISTFKDFLLENTGLEPIKPRAAFALDENMDMAMKKITRARILYSHLPAIDCAACGSPGCKSLAEDIVQERAAITDCVFIQKLMLINSDITTDECFDMVEKVWGREKFSEMAKKR